MKKSARLLITLFISFLFLSCLASPMAYAELDSQDIDLNTDTLYEDNRLNTADNNQNYAPLYAQNSPENNISVNQNFTDSNATRVDNANNSAARVTDTTDTNSIKLVENADSHAIRLTDNDNENDAQALDQQPKTATPAQSSAQNQDDEDDDRDSNAKEIKPLSKHTAMDIKHEGWSVTAKTKKDTNKEFKYEIETVYPQISGKKLNRNAQQFNKLVTALVNTEVNSFKNLVKIDSVHMKTLPEELQKNYLHVDYDLYFTQPHGKKILGLRISLSGMQAGRAHPFLQHRVLNYDLDTGKSLQLKDIFTPARKYLNFLSTYSRHELKKKLEDKFMIDEGTQPIAKNFQNWNFKENSLLITFDEYQVAPYVYGMQEINIPFDQLKKWLNKEYQ